MLMLISRRQLHLWVSDNDYQYLAARAADGEVSLGAVIRQLLRQARQADRTRPSTPQRVRSLIANSRRLGDAANDRGGK
jgi:hypothetical protein